MRIKRPSGGIVEGDLTPMIDMAFQLIAFFMVLLNFDQGDQNEMVQLPASAMAKPPEGPEEFPITIHLGKDGTVFFGGQQVASLNGLRPYLQAEANVLERRKQALADAKIIIRAHKDAPTGQVQELIKVCQEARFERFALRAKEEVGQ